MRLNLKAIKWSSWSIVSRYGRKRIPFVLNPPQQMIRDRLQARSDAGRPMSAIVLKGRRCGSSTYCEAIVTAHCIAFANAAAMTIAHKGKNAKALFETARHFHSEFAESIGQRFDSNVHELFFPHQDGQATHTLATAGTVEGGRGLMLSALLASECAFYENATAVFTALESTVSDDSGSLVLYESTANGRTGNGEAFFEKWTEAVEGKNDLEPIFISWLMDPGDRRPAEWGQPPYDKEEQELIEIHGADAEQIAFRRWAIPNKTQSSPELFKQEYPTTAEEAFLSSGDPAFLPAEMQRVNYSVKHHPIKWFGRMEESKEGEIIFEETHKTSSSFLKLWDKPKQGHYYFVGADAARGLLSPDGERRGDFSAAVGIDGSTGTQAFTFEAKIPIDEFAWQLYLLCLWFNRAKLNIEQTGGDGYYTMKKLRDTYHYPNLMLWRGKDDRRYRQLGSNPSVGWETTYRSRQRMMVTMREVVRTGELAIYCRTLMNQMFNAQRENVFANWEIVRGHDDVFVAAALAIIAWQENPPPRMEMTSTNLLDKQESPELGIGNIEREFGARMRERVKQILTTGSAKPRGDRLEGI